MRRVTSLFLAGLVSFTGAGSLHADADDTSFDVDFYNQSASAGTVYVNGNSVCSLALKQYCTQALAKSGGSYTAEFRGANGSRVSQSVDQSTCGDEGSVSFVIYDDHVDIDCNGFDF